MTIPPNNISAFPFAFREDERAGIGMTLLDYFAGQALCGMLASETEEYVFPTSDRAARRAYDIAEAMLEERNERIAVSSLTETD